MNLTRALSFKDTNYIPLHERVALTEVYRDGQADTSQRSVSV